jgi:diacylglycerol kinase family enzyme
MIVIFNPTAGRRRVRQLWRVIDLLLTTGIRLDLVETQRPGHAIDIARSAARAAHPLVVAAGGDGTVAEVAQGLHGSDCKLGIIPLGTANVLAHELALPFAPHAIAAALAMARTRDIWPGAFHAEAGPGTGRDAPTGAGTDPGRHGMFVQMLGAGFDAQVVHRISLPLKRRLGAMAYALQAGRELIRYGFAPIRVRLDGTAHEAASVIVSKGSLYGGRYTLAPGMAPTRQGFTVALFQRSGPLAAMCYGAALPLGMLPRMPGLRLLPARDIVIDGPTVPVQTDGDDAGRAPLHVADATCPIKVVVP